MGERRGGRFLQLYHMAERAISGVILAGMVVVILLATWSFLRTIYTVTLDLDSALDYAQFQTLFDRVLAAVIAVELAHSIRMMVAGNHGLAQLKTVVVIGMLAVVRKIITVEVDNTTGLFLIGVASAIIALGGVLVAIQWIERHVTPEQGGSSHGWTDAPPPARPEGDQPTAKTP